MVGTALPALLALVSLVPVGPVAAQSAGGDATTPGAPSANSESTADSLPETPPVVRNIVFPVVGPVTFTDTWGACRSGCTRTHKGVDVFGVRLAPLVAATDGTIVSVRRSGLTRAGNMVSIRDDEGWYYLYLHLNNDTPGTDDGANPQAWIIPNRLGVGDRVTAGEVIGYLGDSGNAETTPAHLHFEIHQPGVGAINPTPSVQAAEDEGRVRSVASLASTADGRDQYSAMISEHYRAVLGREPTRAELVAWADRFAIGFATSDDLLADLAMAPQRRDPAAVALRAYKVMLGRRPGPDALAYWAEQYRAGARTEAIVWALVHSAEFNGPVGMSDGQFVEVVYRNARGRAPVASVQRYWLEQLAGGRSRTSMASYFADSSSLRNGIWSELQILLVFDAALGRQPSEDEIRTWRRELDRGILLADVTEAIAAPEPEPSGEG